tara:strand:+ start:227 stop:838 length:612 start_codon:yes stop_codon:yes gene_type:complete
MMTSTIEIVNDTPKREGGTENVDLFSQQIWCWGRDILREEGNWLIQQGFDGINAPAEKAGCKNIYTLSLSKSQSVILRGFGVLFTDHNYGTIFLPRYDFRPKYNRNTELEILPWEFGDLSEFKFPADLEIDYCSSMLIQLIDWIIEYEKELQDKLGTGYRASTLREWDNGERVVIAAKDIIGEWLRIRDELKKSSVQLSIDFI